MGWNHLNVIKDLSFKTSIYVLSKDTLNFFQCLWFLIKMNHLGLELFSVCKHTKIKRTFYFETDSWPKPIIPISVHSNHRVTVEATHLPIILLDDSWVLMCFKVSALPFLAWNLHLLPFDESSCVKLSDQDT